MRITELAAERGRTVTLYILAEVDGVRRPRTTIPRGMSLTLSALVPDDGASPPSAASHRLPALHVLTTGLLVPNLHLSPCRHDHVPWQPVDGEPAVQWHVLGRSDGLPGGLWLCESGTTPCLATGHHCDGVLGRLPDCDVHLMLCVDRETEFPHQLRYAGVGADSTGPDVVARRHCVEEAVDHRRRLRGLTGDLEFLRYLSMLPEHERAWVAKSSVELQRAGGDLDTTERRLTEQLRNLDNSARHEQWRALDVDDRVTLLQHSAHMRSWVTHELVELNDFLHATRSAENINEVAAHMVELDHLAASGWAEELTQVRTDLIRHARDYGDVLMSMRPERRAVEWRRRLDRSARDFLAEVCPAVKAWRAASPSARIPKPGRI